jgi:cytoskeletal protein CcmA (bactofilin family)
MFSDKKNKQAQIVSSERNIIGSSTKITGDISSEGDFRIEGTVDGTIHTSGRLIVGREGVVTGTVNCENADVEGMISGTLNCTGTLTLKSTAVIDGEVFIEKLAVEPGATFNASCSMKGIKALNNGQRKENTKKSVS